MAKKKEGKNEKVMEEVRSLLQSHRKIEAVGLCVRDVGCSLAEAKRIVDAEEKDLGLKHQIIPDKDLVQLQENFVWANGEQTEFRNWASDEPNNQSGNEDTAIIWRTDQPYGPPGMWNDGDGKNTPAVIERDTPP